MKYIIFDAGPVISLATNNLLGILPGLKKQFDGEFFIPVNVKEELVERPFETKKFKLEALQIMKLIKDGVIKVVKSEKIKQDAKKLFDLANNSFSSKGSYIQLVHPAEMEVLALANFLNAPAAVVDERTTRQLMEDPEKLKSKMERQLHTSIDINKSNIDRFRNLTKNIKVIRSFELAVIAYEIGLLDEYILDIPEPRKQLMQAVLWGIKLHGCAVSHMEIDKVVKMEVNRKTNQVQK